MTSSSSSDSSNILNTNSNSKAKPKLHTRYKVQSSDVLLDARINILDETTEQVIWFKERFLGDEEIIEHLVHSPTSTIHWVIHRPSRKGWYIRIRSPTFPPGVYIPLAPIPRRDGLWEEGALGFSVRASGGTTVARNSTGKDSVMTSPNASVATIHSYPPTPPAPTITLRPSSPEFESASSSAAASASASSAALLDSPSKRVIQATAASSLSSSSNSVSEFILSPITSSAVISSPSREGLFSRALKAFRYYSSSELISSGYGYSFSLSRVVLQAPPPYVPSGAPPPPTGAGAILPVPTTSPSMSPSPARPPASGPNLGPNLALPPLRKLKSPIPLLTFDDLTPAFNVSGSLTGMLTLDMREAEELGVDKGFWIAVGLVYIGFLEERGSYLASLGD